MNHVNDFLTHPRFNALVARFHTKYERRGPDECWPWRDRRNGRTKYGMFRCGKKGEQRWSAHRIAWALAHGPIKPAGLYVCHKCDNPECVNPAHLFLSTHMGNMADRDSKKRAARGERAGKAKFTLEQVLAIRSDQRSFVEIAEDYGVSPSSVGNVRRGANWAHVPGAVTEDRSKGDKHPRAILTAEAVRDIRTGRMSVRDFARLYGVGIRATREAKNRDTWAWLP